MDHLDRIFDPGNKTMIFQLQASPEGLAVAGLATKNHEARRDTA
jgi:hypothetical protein